MKEFSGRISYMQRFISNLIFTLKFTQQEPSHTFLPHIWSSHLTNFHDCFLDSKSIIIDFSIWYKHTRRKSRKQAYRPLQSHLALWTHM